MAPSEGVTDLDGQRARLVSLLRFRRFDWNAPCPKATIPTRAGAHYYRWEALEGQSRGFANVFMAPGFYRVWCGYGCGWDTIHELTGDEVWTA